MERAIPTIRGIRFHQKINEKAATFVIFILLLIIVGSCTHDPVHRCLIDERNEDNGDKNDDAQENWCLVSYSSSLQI